LRTRLSQSDAPLFPYTKLFRSSPSMSTGSQSRCRVHILMKRPVPGSWTWDAVSINHPGGIIVGFGHAIVISDRVDEMNSMEGMLDRKSTRLNSSHEWSSYAVFC